MLAAAAANLVLALVLTPELGLEGPALATALRSSPPSRSCSGSACARRASRSASCWGGAYRPLVLGANLALGLVLARIAFDPDTLPLVLGLALAGPLLYWLTYYRLVLDPAERSSPAASSGEAELGERRSAAVALGHDQLELCGPLDPGGVVEAKADSRTGS